MCKLICKDFIGRWSITRRIQDNLDGSVSSFFGEANIKKSGRHFRYEEKGKLSLGDQVTLNAKQSYFWRPVGYSVFNIFFSNGDFFHKLDLGMAAKSAGYLAEHLCIADLYKVQYSFVQFPDWQTVWRVTGPKKKYHIHNYFKRI